MGRYGSFTAEPAGGGRYGAFARRDEEWETRGALQVNRRTGATRPRPLPGGKLAITPEPDTSFADFALGRGLAERAKLAGAGVLEGAAALGKLSTPGIIASYATGRNPVLDEGPGPLGALERGAGRIAQRAGERHAELAAGAGLPAPLSAGLAATARTAGQAVDILPAGKLGKAGRGGRKGLALVEDAASGAWERGAKARSGLAPLRATPEDAIGLQRASEALGASPPAAPVEVARIARVADGPHRELTAYDAAGRAVGSVKYTVEPQGGATASLIETGGRGTGVGRKLLLAAEKDAGGPVVPSVTSAEGEGFFGKLAAERSAPPPGATDPVAEAFRRDFFEERTPRLGARETLQAAGRRLSDDFEDELAPILRTAGRIDNTWKAEAEILAQRVRTSAGQSILPVTRGTRVWDAAARDYRPTGGPLVEITNQLDEPTYRNLEAYMAAQSHLEDVRLQAAARTTYAEGLAARRAEVEARRAQLLGTRADERRLYGSQRQMLAEALRAERRAGRAVGRTGVRQAERELPASAASEVAREGVSDLQAMGRFRIAEELRAVRKRSPIVPRPAGLGLRVDQAATARAQELLDHFAATGEAGRLEPLAVAFRDWENRAILDPLVSVGVLSPDQATALRTTRGQHALFRRVDQELQSRGINVHAGEPTAPRFLQAPRRAFPARVSPLRRRAAGLSAESKVAPVISASAEQATRVQRFVDQQAVRNFLADAADRFPAEVGEVRPATAFTKGTFPVFRNGERTLYRAPADLLEAVERLTPRQFSWVEEASREVTSFFRVAATLGAEFIGRNVARDPVTALVFSRHGMLPHEIPAMLLRQAVGEKGARQLAQQFADSPAAHSLYYAMDRESISGALSQARSLARPGGGQRETLRRALNPLRWPKAVFYDLPRAVGAALERAPRLVEMERGIRAGLSPTEAAMAGADVTLNFSKKGRLSGRWNLHEAFVQPELTDIFRFARELAGPRRFTVAAKAMAYVTLPSLAVSWLHRDDPDYQNINPAMKAIYLPVNRIDDGPLEGWWVGVPRPLGLLNLLFGTLPQLAFEHALGANDEAGRQALGRLVEDTPAHWLLQDVPEEGVVVLPTDLIPTALEPLAEIGLNRDFLTHRPIVPERLRDLPEALQYTERTSPALRAVGAATDVSPLRLEAGVRGYGAGSSRLALDVADAAVRAGTDAPARPAEGWARVPGARGFLLRRPLGSGSAEVDRFYRVSGEVQGERGAVRLLARQGGTPAEARAAYPDAGMARLFSGTERAMGELARERDDILRSGAYTAEEKADLLLQIDQRVSLLAARALAEYEARRAP